MATKRFYQIQLHGIYAPQCVAAESNPQLAHILKKLLKCPLENVAVMTMNNNFYVLDDIRPYVKLPKQLMAFNYTKDKQVPGNLLGEHTSRIVINEQLCDVKFNTAEELYKIVAAELRCPVHTMALHNCNRHRYDLRTGKVRDAEKFTEYPFYFAYCPS